VGHQRATDTAIWAGTQLHTLSRASIESITCGGSTHRLATVSFLSFHRMLPTVATGQPRLQPSRTSFRCCGDSC
jgi:hypothetical protein